MAQHFVNASFEAVLREGTTYEQVEEALAPLLSECGISLDECERVDFSELAWFDGSTVGVSVNALKGVDQMSRKPLASAMG